MLILIVAKPGRLREALEALLKAAFRLETINQIDDDSAALKAAVEHDPVLILLDSALPDEEIKVMVEQIKRERPQTRCLVLANTVEQQHIAQSAGADKVLPKGLSTTNLLETVNKLIS